MSEDSLLYAVVSGALGIVGTLLYKRSDRKTAVALNDSRNQDLKTQLKHLKQRYAELEVHLDSCRIANKEFEKVTQEWEVLKKSYQFVFALLYKQLAPKMEEDQDIKIILEELRVIIQAN